MLISINYHNNKRRERESQSYTKKINLCKYGDKSTFYIMSRFIDANILQEGAPTCKEVQALLL